MGLQWDIFCNVIDNHGDLGVCWRLASDLVARGQRVRLWVNHAAALAWMAPQAVQTRNLKVLAWTRPLSAADLALAQADPAQVVVEAFGCEIAPEFIAAYATNTTASGLNDQIAAPFPVWLNLEYLSAEAYVERCHALPSLQRSGPAAGLTKWFFYPGFTHATGGLLREADLAQRQARFDAPAWLAQRGLPTEGEQRVSLFCYEPLALPGLLAQLKQHGLNGKPTRLLVTSGRAEKAVQQALKKHFYNKNGTLPSDLLPGLLSISYLPSLSQADYDHLLWACELNFVRGEDSLVRALWAGKPWVWQTYPQGDGAHHAKLQALLTRLGAPASLQAFHIAWNQGHTAAPPPPLPTPELAAWQCFATSSRRALLAQTDLTSELLRFVRAKQS